MTRADGTAYARHDGRGPAARLPRPTLRSSILHAPMVTLSAPLGGEGPGHRHQQICELEHVWRVDGPGAAPGARIGTSEVFDEFGALIASPDFARGVRGAPSHCLSIHSFRTTARSAPDWSARWCGDGTTTTVKKAALASKDGRRMPVQYTEIFFWRTDAAASRWCCASEDDFAQQLRSLQIEGIILALSTGVAASRCMWIISSRMSTALPAGHGLAKPLRALAAPGRCTVACADGQKCAELLGRVMAMARRSFGPLPALSRKTLSKASSTARFRPSSAGSGRKLR